MGSRQAADEYTTSPEIIKIVRKVFGGTIDLDPASNESSNKVVKAKKYFTKEDNGLIMPWNGNVYLNPPFSTPLVGKFCDKLCNEFLQGNITQFISVTLLSPDAKWCKKLLRKEFTLMVGLRREAFMNDKLQWLPSNDGSPGHLRKSLLFTYGGTNSKEFVYQFEKAGIAFAPNISF